MTATTPERKIGGLYATHEGQEIAFPLKHTDVNAKVNGNLSRVTVTQTFENPFVKTLEAVYIFPLPDEAAVDEMEIQIGDRVIKGNIKKREEAQQIYQQAKAEGRTAGLLEQERDNIFTQSLANILPGEQIEVVIRYSDSLKFTGGDYEFIFPMVVGPRYIPGTGLDSGGGGSAPAPMTQNQDTDIVPDASRLNAPILPEGMRSRHDISLMLEIDAGVSVQKIESPSHKLQIEYFDPPQPPLLRGEESKHSLEDTSNLPLGIRIQLGGGDTIPNKDFILRYQIAGDNTRATVLTQSDDRGGHFALYLIPALKYRSDEILPKDVVFLVDTSGSQSGEPLQQCQVLMRKFINGLNPDDTFTILDFSDRVRQLSKNPLPNTEDNRKKALKYIDKLQASGATEMLSGIQAAIKFPTPEGRVRTIVLLTDGYIGNEDQICAEVQQNLQRGNRLYCFGTGSSVNRYLVNRVAEVGRGMSYVVRHDEPIHQVTTKFFREVNNPVSTNIEVKWNGSGEAPDIYPPKAPDLFAKQPLVLFGRKRDGIDGKLSISGTTAGGQAYEKTFDLKFEQNSGNPAVAQLWGRQRIKALSNQMLTYETREGVEAVTETAIAYQLLSNYTAFVAVSEEVRVNPDGESISVQVPVEMPEGVSHEGVFGGGAQEMERGITMYAARGLRLASPPPAPAAAPTMYGFSLTDPGITEEVHVLASYIEPQEAIAFESYSDEESYIAPEQPVCVLSAVGLDNEAITSLNQHLLQANIPTGLSGNLELQVQFNANNRAIKILVDEQSSTVTDAAMIAEIKRVLLRWKAPVPVSGTVTLVLQIAS
ncbi:VIT domain-containing protein [Oscillatoria sp. FACHB-1406]|uniref:VIT domain-containing protein n=1 Tax=Oscillatoria sp. FACHB-1406 TaxID=2692846 RepID=UPI00168A2A9E|nr:VIT domain-containing protein [Oscillatoria sp. FACHB-1406]MBD2576774.1 after-VIT domain-containing protein [Oscillatoria sp. FACHB-1406]